MKILSPETSASERQNFWDKVSSQFKPVRQAYSTKIYGDGEWRLFKIYFKDFVGKKILKLDLWNEVNNTSILDRAIENGLDVSAVDISPDLCRRALENFKQKGFHPNFVVGDIRKIPLPTDYFDYLYTMGTIEHVPDPENAIREIHRVLKPGGIAVIGVPYRYDIFGRAFIVWLGNKINFLPYGEEKCFSWREFKKLISISNFEIIDRSGAYFMPWFLRFGDMWLHQHAQPLDLLLRPFLFICDWLGKKGFLLKYNSLVAFVVRKK